MCGNSRFNAFCIYGLCKQRYIYGKVIYFWRNVIESVSIDISDRQIDIGVSDDEQVHIEYFDGEKEYFDIIVSEHNALSVKLEFNKEWTDFIGSKAAAEYRKNYSQITNNCYYAFGQYNK